MKNFWIYTLAILIFLVGYTSMYFYIKLEDLHWYHTLLFLGSLLILIPSLYWWLDHLKDYLE